MMNKPLPMKVVVLFLVVYFAVFSALMLACSEDPVSVRPVDSPTVATTSVAPTPNVTKVARTKAPKATSEPDTDRRYPTCTEVQAAGLGPYVRGKDPEYHWYRDGDSDGVACE